MVIGRRHMARMPQLANLRASDAAESNSLNTFLLQRTDPRLNCDVGKLLDAARVSMEELRTSSFLDLPPMSEHVDECQGNYNTSTGLTRVCARPLGT